MMFERTKNFHDNDLHACHAFPDDAIHKNVDGIVLGAGRRGNILAIVVAPPVVWGTGKDLFNQHSMVIQLLAFVHLKCGIQLERGVSTCRIINVADLSQGFITILQAALDKILPSDPSDRYYFVENGEYEQREFATEITRWTGGNGSLKEPSCETASVGMGA